MLAPAAASSSGRFWGFSPAMTREPYQSANSGCESTPAATPAGVHIGTDRRVQREHTLLRSRQDARPSTGGSHQTDTFALPIDVYVGDPGAPGPHRLGDDPTECRDDDGQPHRGQPGPAAGRDRGHAEPDGGEL